MTGEPDPLPELADAIARGREIDWNEMTRRHPERADQIENLRRLESLAEHFANLEVGPPRDGGGERSGSATWGHLRLVAPLASGSFGEVWRAFDPVLQREVALKLRRDDVVRTSSAREFISEARRLAKVRHPNILGVHGADIHDGRVGLWAELLEGETLEQVMEESEVFPLERRIEIGRDLAQALAAVHGAGLVHGDVKAANIALEPDGRTVLMDFGAGTDLIEADGGGASYGSPMSAAPERLEGGPLHASADVWSLGVVLYRLAEGGRYPFEADDLDGLKALHRRRAETRTSVNLEMAPRGLRTQVNEMLAPRPEERPSAREVAARLDWIAEAPRRRRHRLTVAVVIGSLLMGTVAAGIGYLRARTAAVEAEAARLDAEEVSRFLEEVLGAPRMLDGGRNVLFTEVLDGARYRLEATLPEGSPARARIWEILGGTYISLDRFDAAEPLLRKAISELAAAYDEIHPRAISAKILLAESIRKLGRRDEAAELVLEAAALAEMLPPDHEVQIWLRLNQAQSASEEGELERAEAYLFEARSLRTGPQWRGDSELQLVEVHLAGIWNEQGRYDEVIEMLEPLADELESTAGMRYGTTLVAWNNLAIALAAVNRSDEALARFERMAAEADAWLGVDHEYAFSSRTNAAAAARSVGRVAEACEAERDLVERSGRIFGADHPMTLSTESNLAVSLKILGDMAEAEGRMDAIALRAHSALGPDHPISYIAGVNRAELRLETGRPRTAMEIATETRARMVARLGESHLFVLAADSVIGAARCALGEFEMGLGVLRATLEAQHELGGPHDQQALLTQIRLGEALAATGRAAEARTVLGEAVKLCEESLAPRHFITLSARAALDRLV